MDAVGQDLRYALRALLKSPGFTVVTVLSLSLGIGATTAVFSVLNAAVLRPLPVAEPGRLVMLMPQLRGQRYILFNPIFEELVRRQHTLSGMFAVSDEPFLKVTFAGDAGPTYLRGSLVSGNYFSVLGLSPSMGRLLTESDDGIPGTRNGRGCAAVISHRFWVRRFHQDPAVIGRTMRVRDAECTLVGVSSVGFESHQTGYSVDVWVPLRSLTDPKLLASHGMAFFSGVMGRLRPGATLRQAESELTLLYQRIQAAEPAPPANSGQSALRPGDLRMRLASGTQGLDTVRRHFGDPLRIIMAVAGLVLLIATFNVANLMLARGTTRAPELATRTALGASRGRLLRQLATEGSLLVALGGGAGVALAWLGTPALASLVSLRYATISIDAAADGPVIAVAIAVTTLAALLAGILPAVRLSRTALQADVTAERRVIGGGHGRRLTRCLVATQLSLSLLLVTAAGLLLRTMVRISAIDPGFRPERVVVLDVRDENPGSSFGTVDPPEEKARRASLYQTLGERLNALPGVQAASLSWLGLFGGSDLWLPLIDADRPDERPLARVDYVSAQYFDTVGMQVLRGRAFNDGDRDGTERVAVVNETLARERFPGRDALGRRLALDYGGEREQPFTVVGIVRDSKYNDLREDQTRPMMWMPLAQAPFRITSVQLRVDPGVSTAVARQAQAAVASADAQLMVRRVTTLSAQIRETTARERLLLGLAGCFGGLALLLAAVGLYGTLAYAVTRRTREFGVRLALGARPWTLLRMVLGEAWTLVAGALVVGLPLALGAGHALRAFLFGVEPQDLATLAGACAVLTLAATLAAYVPARRAAAVDPMVALRDE
jgi:predicted permease